MRPSLACCMTGTYIGKASMGSAARIGARPMEFSMLLAPLGVNVFKEAAQSAGSLVDEKRGKQYFSQKYGYCIDNLVKI